VFVSASIYATCQHCQRDELIEAKRDVCEYGLFVGMGIPMKIRHKIWFEKDGKVLFGSGRYELFKAINESHSLNAAAKKLNMSYRAAWGRLKASEERMGTKLVERSQGKGMYLTAEAMTFLEQFDQLEQKT